MSNYLTKQEIQNRYHNFISAMSSTNPDWDTAIILSKVNQYYLTGTMQDGMLIIKKDGAAIYFARRSYERAKAESPFPEIYPMESYRDAAKIIGADCGVTYVETEIITIGITQRLQKYFNMESIKSLDNVILTVRAVKSLYELEQIEESGKQHDELLIKVVPTLLSEGMSETDLVGMLYENMVRYGYQGISRFSRFQTEMAVGQIGFGDSSIYPTSFDGPGGAYSLCPAVPLLGNRERKLAKGDLVFVDIAFGMNGYHSDKTQVYMFGGEPTDEIITAHRACIDIQSRLAKQLKPGLIPSEIYNTEINNLDADFLQNFMGFGTRQAKFLGHGVGLYVDEMPVIANGFNRPLEADMVIALEPKKGFAGIGMVGVEDTYIVTLDGGRCITGGGRDIIVV